MSLSKVENNYYVEKLLKFLSPASESILTLVKISFDVKNTIKSKGQELVSCIFMIAGAIAGFCLQGVHFILNGAYAGLQIANVLTPRIENVTNNILEKLSNPIKNGVDKFCTGFLTPFRFVSEILTYILDYITELSKHPAIQNLMRTIPKLREYFNLFLKFNSNNNASAKNFIMQ